MTTMQTEGVIQFQYEHEFARIPSDTGPAFQALAFWRARLIELGVVGMDPSRYDGYGFGNLSARVQLPTPPDSASPPTAPTSHVANGVAFLITGTQTAGHATFTRDDVCLVTQHDFARNWVRSLGKVRPSSESMTHAALYECSPAIQFVFHGHCPTLWHNAERLGLPITDLSIGYGTVEMALEVRRLFRQRLCGEAGLLAMGGHEDGILSFGPTADQAGQLWEGHLRPNNVEPHPALATLEPADPTT